MFKFTARRYSFAESTCAAKRSSTDDRYSESARNLGPAQVECEERGGGAGPHCGRGRMEGSLDERFDGICSQRRQRT
jgi:hypothetical protein